MFRHPLYPFMVADVDFFIEFPDGTFGILECKTTNYHCQDKWANNSVPVNYEYRGRHYMSVVNLNVVYFFPAFTATMKMNSLSAEWTGILTVKQI